LGSFISAFGSLFLFVVTLSRFCFVLSYCPGFVLLYCSVFMFNRPVFVLSCYTVQFLCLTVQFLFCLVLLSSFCFVLSHCPGSVLLYCSVFMFNCPVFVLSCLTVQFLFRLALLFSFYV
jgi:hypothetical protein